MSIVSAFLCPHPPLAVPAVGRGGEENIRATLSAMEKAAADIARLAPDTVVYITPHGTVYGDYFHISPGEKAAGDFSRFGAPECALALAYDAQFAAALIAAAQKHGIPAGHEGERDAALDHGVLVPAWYIHQQYTAYKAVRVSPSGQDMAAHYKLGRCIAEAAAHTERKTVVIASGDLSHKLAERGPYGYAPEGPAYDARIAEICESGALHQLFDAKILSLREKAAECGHNSLAVLAGCLDGLPMQSTLLSYEGPFGVGYAVARFAPREESPYIALARQSLEHTVSTRQPLPLPANLPPDMLNTRAGAFVSLHKYGRLRGCIGTIFPTTENVAAEIIQNAVSAGLSDLRFDAVTREELGDLTYKVDILAAPEVISSPAALDVKRYGVIVTAGHKRGLLLPNLDGIDTVEQQIAIARQKAGIAPNEPVQLERFEVTRHE